MTGQLSPSEQIDNAISWYRRYGSAVPTEPFQLNRTVRVVNPELYLAALEASIRRWESGEFGLTLARAYILQPVQMLRDWLRAQALETSVITKEGA